MLRRSFELRGEEYAEGFRFVYEGVLRDLGLDDDDVVAYLAAHRDEVERAIGRRGAEPGRGEGDGGPGFERGAARRARGAVGSPSTRTAIGRLVRFAERLAPWNRKVNLTAITDAGGDGREALPRQPGAAAVARGRPGRCSTSAAAPGFPGMALACARPGPQVTCCDSVARRSPS